LVPLGREEYDCDLLTKIQVAIAIQQNMTRDNQLWSVIFYNEYVDDTNTYKENRIYPMGVYSYWDSDLIPGIDSLVLATVSSATGQTILQQMMDQASLLGFASPQYLLSEGNLEWRFGASLERAANAPFSGSNGDTMDGSDNSDNGWGAYTFIWFRFVLFAFIFCFPFVRIFRLWWAAGGRILFRRNEAGRITGLRYQRPLDNWFVIDTTGRHHDRDPSAAPIRDKLTKEQVMELPEISYEVIADDDNVIDGLNGEQTRPSEDKLDESGHDITIDMGNDDTIVDGIKADGNMTSEDRIVDSAGSETADTNEQNATSPSHSSSKVSFTKTISTTCSICIDEFEDGEKIRLLPRCGHGYHTECIMPWLTERQGCCPFCKTSVLEPESEDKDDDNHSGEEEDQESQEGEDQQQQQEDQQPQR
jgi:hypothetical protein